MTNTEKHRTLHGIAMQLAPCLRDKFDFSTDQQFTDWATLSFKAAKAFLDVTDPMFDAAIKKDAADADAAAKAAQDAAIKSANTEVPT